MRLIDADALNKKLKERVGPPETEDLYKVNMAIINAPTVEIKLFNFVQTMKDWRRMCKAYTTDDESCCEGCPVVDYHEHGCGAVFEMEDDTDWQRYEETIAAWAEEHPEPEFPTWYDYLCNIGVLNGCATASEVLAALTELHVAPAIAERLDLSPE